MADCQTLLDESARRYPARPALTAGARTLTYAELAAAVDRLAVPLADLVPGQRVAIIAPNCPALPVALFAVWRAGGVPVPLNARYREYELRRILLDADVSMIVTVASYRGHSFLATLTTLLPDLSSLRRFIVVNDAGELAALLAADGNDAARDLGPEIGALLYTSGTTGEPKGALVPHTREVLGAAAINAVLGAQETDVAVLVPPISHAFGLSCFLAMVAAGGHTVLAEVSLSTAPIATAVEEHRATILHGSPALFLALLKLPLAGWSAPRTGLVAGAFCPAQVFARCDALGCTLLNLYGATELGTVACCRRDDPPDVRLNTVGRALPGYTLRTVDDEVQVGGPYVTPGYYRRPARTAAAFMDGWFRTGDLGTLDAAGRLCITGRATEVIHVAGFNVFPAEIEGFLLTHPDVDQAAVVGVPHATMGEVPQAFVVARRGAALAPSELLRYARAQIAGYKLPYAIRIVPELPVLASGKPDRLALARLAEEDARAE